MPEELKSSEQGQETASQEQEALDLVAKITDLKATAHTKEDYQQLTKLYQQLEQLYEGGEGRELEPWLAEQYERQMDILNSAAIIDKLESGELGIRGIDGKEYPAPTQEMIAKAIEENKELIEKKKEQGFTRFLMVPFGMKLDELITIYGQTIVKHKEDNKLFAAKKDPSDPNERLVPLELDENQPVYRWDAYNNADVEGKIVYYPEQFDKKNHKGRTKKEILESQNKENDVVAGWNILLIEDMPNIPETDPKTIGGRTQIDAKGSAMEKFLSGKKVPTPEEYLQFIERETIYSDEQGMTPEDQLMYAIYYLEETNQVIDDFRGNGKASYQIGAYFPASDYVPYAYWYRDSRQASVDRNTPGDQDDYCGVRSAVRIKKS